MQNLKGYTTFFLVFFVCACLSAQKLNFKKTDSITIAESNKPEWKIDSMRLIPKETEIEHWETDSSLVYICKSSHQYDADEYIPWRLGLNKRVDINLGAGGTFSDGDYAPFWMTNNQHGIGSNKINNQYLRFKTLGYKGFRSNGNILGLTAVADIIASNNLSADFYIQQLYAELGYKAATLSIGMKERYSLFKNRELSSGGLTLSNNARPIPQVEFALPQFVSIPGTNGRFQVMGGLSYGLFLDDNFKHHNAADGKYADDVLYHRKYGFLKYRPNETWSFIGGLEMDTQWGGLFYQDGELWRKSSAKFIDAFKVLLPMSGGGDSNITDQVNILGNVYGSIHLIANYRNENLAIKAYREHFFEDHSGLFLKNIPDGLYGLEIHFNNISWISDILVEYLHTKDQSGPFLWDKTAEIPIQVSGGDNYYNQVDYVSLTNFGYVIGNPLFTSPIYNNGSSLTVYNTRLSSFHFGFAGNIFSDLRYRTLLTYSRSWGTPLIPSINIRDQFSSMLELTYTNRKRLKEWFFSGAVAYDKSEMIGDNVGLQLKLSKSFRIR